MQLTYGYSYGDILFLQTISRLATVLGVIPSFNYKRRRLSYKILYRCYALCFVCAVTSASMVSLCYRFEKEIGPITSKSLDFVVEITGLMLCIVNVFGSSFWNMKNWHRLMIQLSRLERPTNLNTRGNRNRSLKKNPLVLAVVGSLYYIVLSLGNFYLMELDIFVSHLTHILLHYIKFVVVIMIYYVNLSIKGKYKGLNNLLLGVHSTNVEKKYFLRIIAKVRILNLELDSVVETFNSFFGWPALLLLAHSFAQILGSLSLLTMKPYNTILFMDTVLISYTSGDIAVILITISGCDNAMRASRELFKNCCELKATLPLGSKEMEEMEKLQITFQKQTKFTAAGFFEINRSLLLSIFSTITTYMIVVIQFNSIKSNSTNNNNNM